MTIELFTAFFGRQHLAMLHQSMLPSLWLDDNLPALLRAGHNLVHHIYCTTNEASEIVPCCEVETIINTSILQADQSDGWNRCTVYRCFQDAITRGNIVIVAQADHVFGHGLAKTVLGLNKGEMIVCGHPRISIERGFKMIEPFIDIEKQDPFLDNTSFVPFFMETIPHPMVDHGKIHPEEYWRTTRRVDHWETFFKEPPPLAFWGTTDMLEAWVGASHGTLEVMDHELPDWLLERGRLKTVDDSRQFFWGELTSDRIYLPTIRNDIWLPACHHFSKVPLRWYFAPKTV